MRGQVGLLATCNLRCERTRFEILLKRFTGFITLIPYKDNLLLPRGSNVLTVKDRYLFFVE